MKHRSLFLLLFLTTATLPAQQNLTDLGYPPLWDSIAFRRVLAVMPELVLSDEGYRLTDITAPAIYSPIVENTPYHRPNQQQGAARISPLFMRTFKDGHYGLTDTSGTVLSSTKWTWLEWGHQNRERYIAYGSRYANAYERDGTPVLKADTFTYVEQFPDGNYLAQTINGYGLFAEDGQELIPCRYRKINALAAPGYGEVPNWYLLQPKEGPPVLITRNLKWAIPLSEDVRTSYLYNGRYLRVGKSPQAMYDLTNGVVLNADHHYKLNGPYGRFEYFYAGGNGAYNGYLVSADGTIRLSDSIRPMVSPYGGNYQNLRLTRSMPFVPGRGNTSDLKGAVDSAGWIVPPLFTSVNRLTDSIWAVRNSSGKAALYNIERPDEALVFAFQNIRSYGNNEYILATKNDATGEKRYTVLRADSLIGLATDVPITGHSVGIFERCGRVYFARNRERARGEILDIGGQAVFPAGYRIGSTVEEHLKVYAVDGTVYSAECPLSVNNLVPWTSEYEPTDAGSVSPPPSPMLSAMGADPAFTPTEVTVTDTGLTTRSGERFDEINFTLADWRAYPDRTVTEPTARGQGKGELDATISAYLPGVEAYVIFFPGKVQDYITRDGKLFFGGKFVANIAHERGIYQAQRKVDGQRVNGYMIYGGKEVLPFVAGKRTIDGGILIRGKSKRYYRDGTRIE